MICENCGGKIPEGSKVCSFCETEVRGAGCGEGLGEPTDLEKRIAEIMAGAGCKSCRQAEGGAADKNMDGPKPSWWKEGQGDCSQCGGGLTGTDKDMKYALFLIGLIVGVIGFGLLLSKLI